MRRIELRQHKGHLFASLHNEPAEMPDDTWLPEIDNVNAALTDPDSPAAF